MAEYISREAVYEVIEEEGKRIGMTVCNRINCKELIRRMPAADVAEVKQGKWKKHTDDYDCDYIECSICGEKFYLPDNEFTFDVTPKYCPNCGAKMDHRQTRPKSRMGEADKKS